MTVERHCSLEHVYYECRLYGDSVYYSFAQYCFWRNVYKTKNPNWIWCLPLEYREG